VRELLAQTRRAYAKRGARPRKQRALTKDPLQAVLATCDDTLRGKRDRALLLFAWATGGRRRSEVASAGPWPPLAR
jgi:integrase